MGKASRRQLLMAGAAAAAGGCFPDVGGEWPVLSEACRDGDELLPPAEPSPVAELRRDDAVTLDPATQRATFNAGPIRELLEATLLALAPSRSPWRRILPDWTPETRIGIKVNALNDACPTSLALVKALVDSLVDGLGASRERIIVWDRCLDELAPIGFTEAALGARVMGTERSVGDGSEPGYGKPTCGVVAGRAPRLSRILTELTDLTINVPVLKTHAICGVTGALKNIYGLIHNPGDYHQSLNTALPQLYRLPPVRKALRFHLMDGLIAVINGGTSSSPDAVPRRLLASADPVALDSRALALVDQLRGELQLAPVDRSVMRWMENAQALGLGSLQYAMKG